MGPEGLHRCQSRRRKQSHQTIQCHQNENVTLHLQIWAEKIRDTQVVKFMWVFQNLSNFKVWNAPDFMHFYKKYSAHIQIRLQSGKAICIFLFPLSLMQHFVNSKDSNIWWINEQSETRKALGKMEIYLNYSEERSRWPEWSSSPQRQSHPRQCAALVST